MSFKTLEQRFNENVNKLYAGATTKFDEGQASLGKSDAPLIVTKPGKGLKNIKVEGRSLPIASGPQDVKRLTLFQLSKGGLTFLAKQQLLQTGNTFEQTRLINPAFVVANAIPFLHVKRNLKPLSELFSSSDRSDSNVKKMGYVQVGTYETLGKRYITPSFVKDHVAKMFGSSADYVNEEGNTPTSALGKLGNTLASAISPLVGTLSAFTAKRNIGDKWGFDDTENQKYWKYGRPELYYLSEGPTEEQGPSSDAALANTAYTGLMQGNILGIFSDTSISEEDTWTASPYIGEVDTSRTGILDTLITTPNNYHRYVDNSQLRKASAENTDKTLKPYKILRVLDTEQNKQTQDANKPFADPIIVSFAMGTEYNHVQFRAFITDLQQTVTPTYKDMQYIGRIEKFITYVGVQRQLSFKIHVIAFSEEELDVVWTKINYLTGLAYPLGFTQGVHQPNIMRFTIGNVFVDQPGYLTSLTTSFEEISESWDITADVPIAATLNMNITLIEKATRIASSPFYGITEQITEQTEVGATEFGSGYTTVPLFDKYIPVPVIKNENATAPKNPTTEAPAPPAPEPVKTEVSRQSGAATQQPTGRRGTASAAGRTNQNEQRTRATGGAAVTTGTAVGGVGATGKTNQRTQPIVTFDKTPRPAPKLGFAGMAADFAPKNR